MLVVVDTNILVAGHINPTGAPALIVDMLGAELLRAAYSDAILDEYARVLSMPAFGFDYAADVRPFLLQLEAEGLWMTDLPPFEFGLPDPSDEPFLATALAAGAECLITSNSRHFPPRLRRGVRVMLPGRFCRRFLPGYRG